MAKDRSALRAGFLMLVSLGLIIAVVTIICLLFRFGHIAVRLGS